MEWIQRYLGTNKVVRGAKTDDTQKRAKELAKIYLSEKEFWRLINNLYEQAKTFEEIDLAAKLIGVKKDFRKDIDLDKLGHWLTFTQGWAECDCLCQSNFGAEEILERWREWKEFLKKLNRSKNIQQRRASLVLLCKALRQSDDNRLAKMALEQIEKLKTEKEILITKAVSWILRSMVKHHKELVTIYLTKNKDSLPKIAYREALNKVLTGKKTKYSDILCLC